MSMSLPWLSFIRIEFDHPKGKFVRTLDVTRGDADKEACRRSISFFDNPRVLSLTKFAGSKPGSVVMTKKVCSKIIIVQNTNINVTPDWAAINTFKKGPDLTAFDVLLKMLMAETDNIKVAG